METKMPVFDPEKEKRMLITVSNLLCELGHAEFDDWTEIDVCVEIKGLSIENIHLWVMGDIKDLKARGPNGDI